MACLRQAQGGEEQQALLTLDRKDPGALIDALRTALAGRVPTAETSDAPTTAAGVLIPLHYHDDDWHVILNVRSHHVGQHKDEIAFPGGRLEEYDEDMQACALRETCEEMGIAPEDVDVLGPLNARLTRTSFLVWPTVGVVPYPYAFKADPREVAEVIEIPLDSLLDGSTVRHEARLGRDGGLINRVAYGHGEHLVFGATAWILADLLQIISDIGWGPKG